MTVFGESTEKKSAPESRRALREIEPTRDDEYRLLQPIGASGTIDERFQNLVVQVRSERGQSREPDLVDEVHSVLFSLESVTFDTRVHEPDLNTVVVEQRGGECDSRDDQFQLSYRDGVREVVEREWERRSLRRRFEILLLRKPSIQSLKIGYRRVS